MLPAEMILSETEIADEHADGLETSDWIDAFFGDVDKKQIDALAPWFADKIELRFSNAPAIQGKEEATDALFQFYTRITGMWHRREALSIDGRSASSMAIATYTLADGREIDVSGSTYLRRVTDGKLDRLWIYADMSPLLAAAL